MTRKTDDSRPSARACAAYDAAVARLPPGVRLPTVSPFGENEVTVKGARGSRVPCELVEAVALIYERGADGKTPPGVKLPRLDHLSFSNGPGVWIAQHTSPGNNLPLPMLVSVATRGYATREVIACAVSKALAEPPTLALLRRAKAEECAHFNAPEAERRAGLLGPAYVHALAAEGASLSALFTAGGVEFAHASTRNLLRAYGGRVPEARDALFAALGKILRDSVHRAAAPVAETVPLPVPPVEALHRTTGLFLAAENVREYPDRWQTTFGETDHVLAAAMDGGEPAQSAALVVYAAFAEAVEAKLLAVYAEESARLLAGAWNGKPRPPQTAETDDTDEE